MHGDQLVNRMADEPVMDCEGFCSRCSRLRADCLVAAQAGALGQAILAALRHVLHPPCPRLASLATDLDRRTAALTDRYVCSTRRPLDLPKQRLVHGIAEPRRADLLEVHRDLRGPRDGQRRTRPFHLLGWPGA